MARALARTLTTAALTTGLALPLAAVGGTALADPQKAELIHLTCDGVTYHVAVFSRGLFTPALDTEGNKVFIPHSFIDFVGYLYDDHGVLVESWDDDPDEIQGQGNQPRDLTCTYRTTYTFTGEEGPDAPPAGYVFVGTGTVIGQVAGH